VTGFGIGAPSLLGRPLLTGGTAGSRAEEAQKSATSVQAPAGRLGLLRRALDAAVEPVTLAGCREGAHPTHGAGA
jgi:hypothetical protein